MTKTLPSSMHAWQVTTPGPVDSSPLKYVEVPLPSLRAGEVLVKVLACGVCRTDLHVVEGDLPVHTPHIIPGHEIVGEVVAVADDVSTVKLGARVGVAWLHQTCGQCKFCRSGQENLCPYSRYTGWDEPGGYAEYVAARADFIYSLPDTLETVAAAPLLCAGIIGYRALERSTLNSGGILGIYGFGGSAHLTAQLALAQGARVHVMTRSAKDQALAEQLGANSVQGSYDQPPEKLNAAILFAPVGDMVPPALQALERGGTLAIAGIHLTDIPKLNYETELFYEKNLVSVTSNTRQDGRTFLVLASQYHIKSTTHIYPMAQAPQALSDLAHDAFNGAAVLVW